MVRSPSGQLGAPPCLPCGPWPHRPQPPSRHWFHVFIKLQYETASRFKQLVKYTIHAMNDTCSNELD